MMFFFSGIGGLELFSSDPLTGYALRGIVWLLTQPLFWAITGVMTGPILFFLGFNLLQRKRLIMNIPRSTIRAAAIGPVEISGRATGPYTLVSPLSKRECLYYKIVVRPQDQAQSAYSETRNSDAALLAFVFALFRQSARRNSGRVVDEMCAPLFIEDGTGELMVYPKGAETELTAFKGDGGELCDVLIRQGFSRSDIAAAEEYCILPDEEVFVMGTLAENPWKLKPTREDGEMARIGPGFVSADEASLLRQEAFSYLVGPASSVAIQERSFELYPPSIITKGNCPFIISKHSQREILSKLAWKSLLFIWVGPIWTLWAVWELLNDPNVWALLGQHR